MSALLVFLQLFVKEKELAVLQAEGSDHPWDGDHRAPWSKHSAVFMLSVYITLQIIEEPSLV